MSLQILQKTFESLPYALAEQAIGYARAIDAAAPDIFKAAGVPKTQDLTNQLVFLAGIRKLLAIIDSNYSVVDNAGALLSKSGAGAEVRIGSTDYSRGGAYHQTLERVRREFYALVQEAGLSEYMLGTSLADVVRALANGR